MMRALPRMATRWAVPLVTVVGLGTAGAALVARPASAAFNVVANSDFQQPGTNGGVPTGWNPTGFSQTGTTAQTGTFRAEDATGQDPPPAGMPGGDGAGHFAADVIGSTGVGQAGGSGASQTLSTPLLANQAPYISWSVAEADSPCPGPGDSWAAAMVQISVVPTEGSTPTTDRLRYYTPLTPDCPTPYTLDPGKQNGINTATVDVPASAGWSTQAGRSIDADVRNYLGPEEFTLTSISVGVVGELPTAGTPMHVYFKNVAINGTANPPPDLAETPVALALPAAGVVTAGLVGWIRHRRRRRVGERTVVA